jgi:sporulation protein YlmC with PRC-barrel domain
MDPRCKPFLFAVLLALPAVPVHAQNQQQTGNPAGRAELGSWEVAMLYPNGWSAREMLGAEVRGENGDEIGEVQDIIVERNGTVDRIVVEVGGFLDLGDQHIGVPWKDAKIGQDMAFVQVPLREVRDGTYSLFGRVPQGEQVTAGPDTWRVRELIGDYASVEEITRYGLITDVIFSNRAEAKGVVVDRAAPGPRGFYAYPYAGYPGTSAYRLPYSSADAGQVPRFDYVRLGELSIYAGGRNAASAGSTRERR